MKFLIGLLTTVLAIIFGSLVASYSGLTVGIACMLIPTAILLYALKRGVSNSTLFVFSITLAILLIAIILLSQNKGTIGSSLKVHFDILSSSITNPGKGILSSFWILSLFVVIQVSVAVVAYLKFSKILNKDVTSEKKLSLLKNNESYCELPLYIGLFGTICGFLIMAISPENMQGAKIVAYASTLMGIIISVSIRIFIYVPRSDKCVND